MPQIAQQDYKVIAPKDGREFSNDAAAMGELKKAVLNGIAFDCLLKNFMPSEGTIDRVIGFYEDGSSVSTFDSGNREPKIVDIPYTVTQYQGLAAVQKAVDEAAGTLMTKIPELTDIGLLRLAVDDPDYAICVDGKYLTFTGVSTIEAIAIAENGPAEDFINITWEDAQKLIGLPII